MNMVSVSSSAISSVGYNQNTRKMRIVFTSGKGYDFCGVSYRIYAGLISASSKGRYYNEYIRDRYQC